MTQKNSTFLSQTTSLEEKINRLQKKLNTLENSEGKYHFLIEQGKALAPMLSTQKTKENVVKGCQSQLFLAATKQDDLYFFTADSDALISKGLAALLISIYDGETGETILKTPPTFLETLGILSSLSPNRAQGALHIYLQMKLCVIKSL